jgi:hypothetical protein
VANGDPTPTGSSGFLVSVITGAAALVAMFGVVAASFKVRDRKDKDIYDAIHAGDRALDERVRTQETLCSGVRGEVLTKLNAFEKSQAEQNTKLDKLVGWAENGGGERR